jgi:hypothetical protein
MSNPSLARESATPLCVLDMWNTFESPAKEELMMCVYGAALQSGMSKRSTLFKSNSKRLAILT